MLDNTGFKRPRFDDIFADMDVKAKEVFGETVNTSARSPLGLILRLFAWMQARLWQDTEDVYNSAFINTSTGNNLDRLGPYIGITRIGEQYATGKVTLTGTVGYIVPAGFRVAAGDTYFETAAAFTIGGGGTVTADVIAVAPGQSGNVAAGTITDIVNPSADVTSVSNTAETAGGRKKETDDEFRSRFAASVSTGGAATADSIRGALLGVYGVRAAVVIENATNVTDSDGRPPHSFQAYVLGGTPDDIGRAIFGKKAAGIESIGSQTVIVKDLADYPHTVKFSYAVTVNLTVRVTIKKSNSFPVDGTAQIKLAVIRYIGGEDTDGQVYTGYLSMGDDVIRSRIEAAILAIPGVEDANVELSINGGTTWTSANVIIAQQQVAQTSATAVTVVIAP